MKKVIKNQLIKPKKITRAKLKIIAATIVLLCTVLHSCTNGNEETHPLAGECVECAFKQTYEAFFSNDDVYFVKGIAMDVYEYGRDIKVIEDLKGNFDNKSYIFVWGHGCPSKGVCLAGDRADVITQYNKNDTLIMFVAKACKRFNDDIEKPGDYTTMGCCYSILKISKLFVIGYILPYDEKEYVYRIKKEKFDSMTREERQLYFKGLSEEEYKMGLMETMSWNEFLLLITQ